MNIESIVCAIQERLDSGGITPESNSAIDFTASLRPAWTVAYKEGVSTLSLITAENQLLIDLYTGNTPDGRAIIVARIPPGTEIPVAVHQTHYEGTDEVRVTISPNVWKPNYQGIVLHAQPIDESNSAIMPAHSVQQAMDIATNALAHQYETFLYQGRAR